MTQRTRRSFLKASAAGVCGVAAAAGAQVPDEKPVDGQATYRLVRDVPIEDGYDVVVAGGGPAGAAAAICAARLGAKVVLIEATGCLGGMGSNALVSFWFSMGDGKDNFVGGLILELVQSLCRDKHVNPRAYELFQQSKPVDAVGFNPEALKLLLDRLCEEAGVEVRFFTRVIDADADREGRRVRGIITNSVEGHRCIRAKTFIDATGDAILADLCGAPSRTAGRDTAKIMPPTLCARIANVNFGQFGKVSQQEMVEKAIAENFFSQADRHVPGIIPTGTDDAMMNAGHLFHTDALKTRSLSEGIRRGRRLVQEYAAFFRKYMPGCESMKVMSTGSLLGVRESRRIVGEYELNYADFQARRHFPDQIAIYGKAVDIHVYDLTPEEYRRYHEEYNSLDKLKPGESYGIPYGILVPRGWSNLWVAGRCTSADIKVNGAIRDQPGCSMMGQAAGTAAVQSIRTGQPADDLDTEQLVLTLRKAGANLPQQSTCRSMTRA